MFAVPSPDGEHPAVPGDRVAGPVLHVEHRLDPGIGVAGRLPVRADRGAVGPRRGAERTERATEAAVRAIGDDDVARSHLAQRSVTGLLHPRAAHEAPVHDRGDGFVTVEQRRAGALGGAGDELVELASPDDIPVLREDGMDRPWQLHVAAQRCRPEADDPVESCQLVGQPHVGELLHGPRRECITARLVARIRASLEDRDVVAVARQPEPGRGTGGSATDDEDVDLPRGHGVPVTAATGVGRCRFPRWCRRSGTRPRGR